ncbi:MAG: molecular chaperone TorD family protein [Deltaproteobacteria bacterium]|nr:molecular chaperone TorD family protein [Deltaproteobacteria bacterium]
MPMDHDEFQQLMKARENVYGLLRCFFLLEPTEEFLKALREEDILKNLRGYHPDLDKGVDLISEVVGSPELDQLSPGLLQEFTRLFVGPVPVPLYESVYRSESGLLMQQETFSVRAKYLEAGVVVNPENSFPDDHIGAELEFVFYLCQKAGQAEDAKMRDALMEMQYRFFQEHLITWVSPLCDRIYAEAESSYYKGIAQATKGFVSWDYQEFVSHFLD